MKISIRKILESKSNDHALLLSISDERFLTWIENLQESVLDIIPDVIELQPLDDIHVTIAYGINDNDWDGIWDIVDQYEFIDITLDKATSYFDTDNGFCLKIGVYSEVLHKIHHEIFRKFGYFNLYPVYRPHITIGYFNSRGPDFDVDFGEPIHDAYVSWVDAEGNEIDNGMIEERKKV